MRLAFFLEAHATDTRTVDRKVVTHGLHVTIEHPRGTTRHLHDDAGNTVYKQWMHHSYGYIRNTKGRDGDEVDCFLGPMKNAKEVYIVHMKDMGPVPSEREDEDKCMIGFPSADAAKTAFLLHYPDTFYNGMTSLPLSVFKKRLKQAQKPHREKKIHGGGPGSGRLPGNEIREHLSKLGFTHAASNSYLHYYDHPLSSKIASVSVNDNGAWTVRHGSGLGAKIATGEGLKALRPQVSKYRAGQIKSGIDRKVNKEWNKAIQKAQCPNCKSKKFTLMPTDFETAKCKDCGKTYEINAEEI